MNMNSIETTPSVEWLSSRGGELRSGVLSHTWIVLIAGSQQYRLTVVPAAGRFACAITQLNNGKRLDKGTTHPSSQAALINGLDELRGLLGWS
jgi:hypothetical protein